MLILNPEMDDLARDKELAKFEAYINKEQCINIQAVLRSRTRLAYPMQK
ncbi:plastid ribosomal protein S6, partial [Haematococcus lacustris]